MENTKKKKFSIFRIFSLILVCIFCAITFSSCLVGGMGSSSSSSGSGSTTDKDDDKDDDKEDDKEETKPPVYGRENAFKNANDVFLGAIGVYEVGGEAKVFYDEYAKEFVSFNDLVDRQFKTLANILFSGLDSVYGSAGTGGVSISGYGTPVAINYDKLISPSVKLPHNTALNYNNAINGGYDLVVTESSITDSTTGEVIPTYVYEYTTTVLTTNAWKSKITKASDIENALKYIYLNPVNCSTTSTNLDFTDNNLKSEYRIKDLDAMTANSSDIKTIGFTVEYMWNVLYFLSYTIIGETNIDNSINNHNVVVKDYAGEYVYNNESKFETYKAYHLVLKELVSNAFKVTTNGIGVSAFEKDTERVSLFPKLFREQFIYFDDVEKIQDVETSSIGDDYVFVPPEGGFKDYDENFELEGEELDGVNLRQLKRIILIPYKSSAFTHNYFQLDCVMFDMKSESDTFQVSVSWSGFASKTAFNNVVAKFDDGSYVSKKPDGSEEFVKGDSKTVTTEGRLIVDKSVTSVEFESVKFTEDDLLNYHFENAISGVDGVDLTKLISDSFKEDNKGNDYITVYNKLFDINLKTGKCDINISNNLLVADINYCSDSGLTLSEIPNAYLMYFNPSG